MKSVLIVIMMVHQSIDRDQSARLQISRIGMVNCDKYLISSVKSNQGTAEIERQ